MKERVIVRVWVFLIQSSSPFPAIWLEPDVRGECSKKAERMGNKISERGVLPWSKVKKSVGKDVSLFWCT